MQNPSGTIYAGLLVDDIMIFLTIPGINIGYEPAAARACYTTPTLARNVAVQELTFPKL